jgi:predicted nuclease with TOPRIM domain
VSTGNSLSVGRWQLLFVLGTGNEDDEDIEDAKLALQTLHEEAVQEKERLRKENNRLNNALKINEMRVKNSLQDQMSLQQQLHVTEDELVSTKSHLESLRKELESERFVDVHMLTVN